MVKYKYIYDEYLQELDKKRNNLSTELELKVNEDTKNLGLLTENIKKMDRNYIIVGALFALFIYPFYIFINEYLHLWYILVYIGVFLLIYIIMFMIKIGIKEKIKAINKRINTKEYDECIVEYRKYSENIYNIALFIIVVNENYDKLLACDKDKQIKLWSYLVNKRKNIIEVGMKYKPNVEKYQRYLDEWIERNK